MKEVGRKTFFRRFRSACGGEDIPLMSEAYQLAKAIHRPQVRKSGGRYIGHPKEVALILMRYGCTSEQAIVAILHDVLEDGFILPSTLEKIFGDDIADGVKVLSKCTIHLNADGTIVKVKKLSRTYEDRLRQADHRWQQVKCADRIHNLSTMLTLSEEHRRRQVVETRRLYLPMAYDLSRNFDPLAWVYRLMLRKLQAVERSLKKAA